MGVTKRDRIMNEDTRSKAVIEETIEGEVDRISLLWFGHVKTIDEGRWTK